MEGPKNNSYEYLTIFCVLLVTVIIFGAEANTDVKGLNLVLKENCGGDQKHPYLVEGSKYKYSESEVPFDAIAADSPDRTVAFGAKVVYTFKGLRAEAKYKVRVRCLSDSDNRIQSFFADDILLMENTTMPEDKTLEIVFDLPAQSYSDGEVALRVVHKTGPNAVVSTIENDISW